MERAPKFPLSRVLLIIVLAVSVFTHFYRIGNTYIFHNDEARDVLIAKKMIDTGRPVLLGPQTSVGNMYLGPLYYYLVVPSLLITRMDPVGPAMMVAFFAVVTTGLLFWLGSRRFGVLAGTVAALIYSLSPVMVHYARSSWNPNLVPFFSAVLIWTYYSSRAWSWLVLGIAAGAIFQLHYVGLVFVLLVAAAKWYRQRQLRTLPILLGGFLVTSLPFWFFELRHDWVNTSAFIRFLADATSSGNETGYLDRVIANSQLVVEGIVGSRPLAFSPVPLLFSSFATLLFVLGLILVPASRFFLYLVGGSILIVSLLRGETHVHYVAFLFPVVALFFGSLLGSASRWLPWLTAVFLVLASWLQAPILVYNLAGIESSQSVRARAVARYIESQADGQQYYVVATSGTYATPVEYFLSLSDNPPSSANAKLVFDICEGKPCPASDLTSVNFLAQGATHPAIIEYLGHPQQFDFQTKRTLINNEHVAHGLYVATIRLEP